MTTALQTMNGLTPDARDQALKTTREKIAGTEPVLEDFLTNTYSKFPPSVIRQARALAFVLLAAAFLPSAIRIFISSYELTAKIPSLEDAPGLLIVIALASIVLAETGQVAFSLWAATVTGWWIKFFLWIGAIGCTAFALAANFHVVDPAKNGGALAWIETLLPPLLVLISSHVLKSQILHEIQNRHAANEQYRAALREWEGRRDAAHEHHSWQRTVANQLKQALMVANRQKTKVLRELTDEDWKTLVIRELDAENWWVNANTNVRANASFAPVHSRPVVRKPRSQAAFANDHSPRTVNAANGYIKNMNAEAAVREYLTANSARSDIWTMSANAFADELMSAGIQVGRTKAYEVRRQMQQEANDANR